MTLPLETDPSADAARLRSIAGERCVCVSIDGLIRCSGTATKDDGLCDFCRTAKGGHR